MAISDLASVDPDKEQILTGKNDRLIGFYESFQYTMLGMFIIFRLKENRDMKILITGKGKSTGTGKTTLAILLAHYVNWVRNQLFDKEVKWNSKEYSFMNVWEYLSQYSEADIGDPLITDELEYMADRRRHQTHENIKFSQAWSVLRYKNVVTIGTAPGLMDLEKRIPEGADIWINVIHKGKANPYYLTVDDFRWKPVFKRLRKGKYRESILWSPIEDSADYQWLDEKKRDIGVPGIDDRPEEEQVDEKDLNQLERDLKNGFARQLLRKLHEKDIRKYFSQEDIAEATNAAEDIEGISQAQVSKIERNMRKEGVIEA